MDNRWPLPPKEASQLNERLDVSPGPNGSPQRGQGDKSDTQILSSVEQTALGRWVAPADQGDVPPLFVETAAVPESRLLSATEGKLRDDVQHAHSPDHVTPLPQGPRHDLPESDQVQDSRPLMR